MVFTDGIAAIDILSNLYPNINLIGISICQQLNIVVDTLNAGAKGFLEKGTESEIQTMIETISAGQFYVSLAYRKALGFFMDCKQRVALTDNSLEKLSKKEKLFLKFIANSISYEEIAKQFHVSTSTLSNYQTSIKAKTGHNDRLQQAFYAQKNGIAKSLRFITSNSPFEFR